jgi:hypothetical protein
MLNESSITKEEFLEFSKEHVSKMEDLVSRYGDLNVPESFVSSVKLFKLSTQKQLESDRHLIEWVSTNDTAEKVQSDLALQEAFEDEMAALSSFNKAKNPAGQG